MNKLTYAAFILFFLFTTLTNAQESLTSELNKNFKAYSLDKIPSAQLYEQLENPNKFHSLSLEVNGINYNLELWDSGILDAKNIVTLASGKKHDHSKPLPLQGKIVDQPNSSVRLTINEGFIYGYIKTNGQTLNIQPARHFHKDANRDEFISFYSSDAIDSDEPHTCGVHAKTDKLIENIENQTQATTKSVGLCYEVEIALAADWLMTQTFGSANNAEDVIVGIMNDVQGNYDDDLADAFEYDISDIFISDCNTCDPWTSSTSSSALLNDFTDWAPSNFSGHDVATLWSDRNFNGSTIGLAWVGSVCSNFSYNVCEHFTNNGNLLRVVQAHEIGHNWDASHDGGGGFIMSPSVNNTNDWSSASETDILNYAAGAGCFTMCSSGNPPTADFDFDIIEDCVVGEVEFFDESSGAAEWFWTFEGGDPETSTDQNPVVNYNIAGTFNVELEVFNAAGDDSYFVANAIQIVSTAFADFDYDAFELEIEFEDESNAGPSAEYFWEFGDGNDSDESDPIHIYDNPGTYTVSMFVENDCGDDEVTKEINVYDNPEADFTVDAAIGCVTDDFEFTDISYGNIEEWDWEFPGGTPNTSTDQNPQVTYNTPGAYPVSLTVSNPEGDDTKFVDTVVVISPNPTTAFSTTINANVVQFNNLSTNASSFSWNFGNGTTSVDMMPTATYAASGNYTVILNSFNACGMSADTQVVNINLDPVAGFSTTQAPSGCADYSINFIDNTAGNPISWNWQFPGGNPASSTIQNPQVLYTNKGNFDVTLIVNNGFVNDTIFSSNFVTIDDVPTLSPSSTNDFLAFNFTSAVTNAQTVLWNFGDGTTSNLPDPQHTYALPGTYNVSVSATNACGTESNNFAVTANVLPVAGFTTAQATSGCADYTVSFRDLTTGVPSAWNWSFPGGNPSTSNLQNPEVTYTTKGVFPVTLEVSNGFANDTISFDNFVTIDDVPTLASSYTSDLLNVSFSAMTTNTQSILWNFGDGTTSNLEEPIHVYNAAGSYNVSVSATNGCGTITENLTVTVEVTPAAQFSSDLRTGCAGLTVNFRDNSSSNATAWNWEFPGGNPSSSTLQNPVVTYASSGQFDVSLTVSNAEGSDTETMANFIDILSAPIASYTTQINGNVVTFSNTTPGTTVSWSTSDGANSDMQTFVHTFGANGIFEITMQVIGQCGTDEVSFDVIMDAFPDSSFTFDSTNGCIPMSVAFENTAVNADSFLWTFEGGTPASSTDPNPTVVYETVGNFDVSLIVENQFGSAEISQQDIISTRDVPSINFEINQTANSGDISLTNTTAGATSFSWDFGDGNTSNVTEPQHTYLATGTYTIVLTATNDCGTIELEKTISLEIISSVNDEEIFGQWQLSPNPSSGIVNLLFDSAIDGEMSYKIVDLTGKFIQGKTLKPGTLRETIEISNRGIYLIFLSKDANTAVKKLTIMN